MMKLRIEFIWEFERENEQSYGNMEKNWFLFFFLLGFEF